MKTLARVDVLCLDKTGTITQGKMIAVKGLELLSERFTKEELERLLAAYMQHRRIKMQQLRLFEMLMRVWNIIIR